MFPAKAVMELVNSTHTNNTSNISFFFISADDFERPVYTPVTSALLHFAYFNLLFLPKIVEFILHQYYCPL